MTDFPYEATVTHEAGPLAAEFGESDFSEEHLGPEVSVAGRLVLKRDQGKMAFGTLADHTGRIQLFMRREFDPDLFDRFVTWSLGDWVVVRGDIMRTRRGELSLRVREATRLAATRIGYPDKWHGITDPDTRYRQRYVDLWVTEESRQAFANRSRIVSLTRRWMEDRGYLEVETPVLHPLPGGALAKPFATHHNALDQQLYLRIAPELYLKRLVVGGFPKVFEIGRVFRNEGMSPRHNPEFTMLECYEAYGDYRVHMELTEQLVAHLANEICGSTTVSYGGREVDLSAPWRRATMSELLSERLDTAVDVRTPVDVLRKLCDDHGTPWEDHYGPGKLLLELYEKTVEHTLWHPTFVTEYPKEVSPLSRVHRDDPELTERFEGIVCGRELCNGFSELCDPDDQRERFEDQARQRAGGDEEAMVVDDDYLRALEFGLPPTVGLGIGIDRLVMLLTDTSTIRDVVLFPTLRPEQVD